MKRLAVVAAAIAVVALIAAPTWALQERGGQAGQSGQSGERGGSGGAVSRPSGGEGGRPMGGGGGGSSGPAGGGGTWSGGSSGPAGGGSSMGSSAGGSSSSRMRGGDAGSRANPRREGQYGGGRFAVPRGEGGGVAKGATAAVTGESGAASSGPIREVPQYSRPRGNRPTVGEAVPRGTVAAPERLRVYYPSRGWYYPYYPDYWYWYPYGYSYPWYGSFGLGFFNYDPCWWGGPGCYYGYGYGYPYGPAVSARYDTGSLRLKVKPRHAEVYVDGYYSGMVDQFDGVFQRLRLETGGHRIEIRAEGYEPLVFDVLVPPFETITYTGELKKKTP